MVVRVDGRAMPSIGGHHPTPDPAMDVPTGTWSILEGTRETVPAGELVGLI